MDYENDVCKIVWNNQLTKQSCPAISFPYTMERLKVAVIEMGYYINLTLGYNAMVVQRTDESGWGVVVAALEPEFKKKAPFREPSED